MSDQDLSGRSFDGERSRGEILRRVVRICPLTAHILPI
jgi:hypothetical protein